MNLKDSITVDLSLQKDNKILTSIPNTIAHLEIESVSVGGKNINASELGNYILISPENSTV